MWNLFNRRCGDSSRMRWVAVLVFSVSLHLVLLWLLGQGVPAKYRPIQTSKDRGGGIAALSVRLIGNDSLAPQTELLEPERAEFAAFEGARTTGKSLIDSTEAHPDATEALTYFSGPQLTRTPFPLSNVDLDVLAIDEVAFAGAIELTILVEADGTVARVSSKVDRDDVRTYVDRVAARFQRTQFSPGEIDGRAVRSKLLITVVSDPIHQAASKS